MNRRILQAFLRSFVNLVKSGGVSGDYWQQVPQVSIAQTYLKIMNKIAEQFGLTPTARSRITAGADMKDAAVDDMDALLGGG